MSDFNPTATRALLSRKVHAVKRRFLRERSKVFGLGFGKTGTTTLSTALEYLDYRALRWRNNRRTPYADCDLAQAQFDKHNLLPEVIQGLMQEMAHYDSTEDFPWPLYYAELDARYPRAKFILTTRDSEAWIRSCIQHFGTYSGRHELAPERNRRENVLHLQRIFGEGMGNPIGHEAEWIRVYEAHNRDVIAHFAGRPDKLLVIDWSQHANPWEPLCAFLDKSVPGVAFPRSNANPR